MSNVALLTLGGVAATGLARSAAQVANQGLSFAAELAKSIVPESTDPAAEQQALLDRMLKEHESRLAEFASRIRRDLAAAGIDVSQPIELTSDGLGGIALAGDHPQRAAIEELLATDVLLQRDFQRLADERASLATDIGDHTLAATLSISTGGTD